jgi:hypothetical protein
VIEADPRRTVFVLRPLNGPPIVVRARREWELHQGAHVGLTYEPGRRYLEDPFTDVVLTVDGREYALPDVRTTRTTTPRGRQLLILEEQSPEVVGRERNASFIEAHTRGRAALTQKEDV